MTTAITHSGQTLTQLENVIEQGKAAFLAVGAALMEIQERRLYEEVGFLTFEDYCRDRHGFSRQQGYRLIDAAKVAEIVSPTGDADAESVPSERVARALAALAKSDPDAARAVWDQVQREAGPITARAVQVVITQRTIQRPAIDYTVVTTPVETTPARRNSVTAADKAWAAQHGPEEEAQDATIASIPDAEQIWSALCAFTTATGAAIRAMDTLNTGGLPFGEAVGILIDGHNSDEDVDVLAGLRRVHTWLNSIL